MEPKNEGGWPPMPEAVATALCNVMADAKTLGKADENKFANYKYAGIESFLEMLRPLCAEHGLIVLQDEEDFEFKDAADKSGKQVTWLVMTFSFGLAHSSGATWAHRVRRTAMVQASMGSQAFGAAQSYALKTFLRSQGLLATGENEDADSHEQSALPRAKSKGKARKGYAELETGLRNCETRTELREFADKHAEDIEAMPADWRGHLRKEYARLIEGMPEDDEAILAHAAANVKLPDGLPK